MGSTATILHADLDAFYASVEQSLALAAREADPVGGGVVLAASTKGGPSAHAVGRPTAGTPTLSRPRVCRWTFRQ